MKSLRTLREDSADKLSVLVEAGLLDSSRLSLLRKALHEDNHKMSKVERNALLESYYKLLDHVAGIEEDLITEEKTKTKNIDINEMPALLILKRRAIRVFPDGQKVALYWADRINRYVTVPFEGVGLSEESLPVTSRYARARDFIDRTNAPVSDSYHEALHTTKNVPSSAGYALGSAIRNKVFNKAYLKMKQLQIARRTSKGQERTAAVRQEPTISENFTTNLNLIREQSALDDAADILIPGVSAFKKFKSGDWGGGLIDAGIDAAGIAAGVFTGGAGYAAIKGLSSAGKAALKGTKLLYNAGKTGGKIALKTAKRIGGAAGKIATGLGVAASLAGAAASSAGSSSGNDIYGKQRPQTGFRNQTQGIDPFRAGEMRNSTGYWDTPVGRRQLYKNAGGGMVAPPANLYEGNVIQELNEMVNSSTQSKNINGVYVTLNMAKNIVDLHESLNTDDKETLEEEVRSQDGFFRALDYSVRN